MENSISKEEIFLLAADNFVNSNYLAAVDNFTQLIQLEDHCYQNYLYRASSNLHLKRYSEALEDLSKAENLKSDYFEILYKKGISQFYLEQFLAANESMKKALLLATNSEQRQKLLLWTNKIEIELEENNLINPSDANPELPSKLNNEIKLIHNWYQTATHVNVNFTTNTPITVKILFEKKSIRILDNFSGNNIIIWEMHLSNSIIPEASSYIVNSRKIELKLKKEIDDFNWVTLDRTKINQATVNVQPSYPTSSKVKKDWNGLEKEITKELADDAKNDPNEGMMRLFKEIYGNANEETRRAMIKSFQTSGGTVLSTNWDEVKQKDYEGSDRPEAPKGQEWRKNI